MSDKKEKTYQNKIDEAIELLRAEGYKVNKEEIDVMRRFILRVRNKNMPFLTRRAAERYQTKHNIKGKIQVI